MRPRKTRTPQQVRADFLRKGKSIGTWADQHGFDRATVNQVLTGRNAGTRGIGHKIAVMLGIKDGVIEDEQLDQRHAA